MLNCLLFNIKLKGVDELKSQIDLMLKEMKNNLI